METTHQTNPLNPDTDNDGYLDGLEIRAGIIRWVWAFGSFHIFTKRILTIFHGIVSISIIQSTEAAVTVECWFDVGAHKDFYLRSGTRSRHAAEVLKPQTAKEHKKPAWLIVVAAVLVVAIGAVVAVLVLMSSSPTNPPVNNNANGNFSNTNTLDNSNTVGVEAVQVEVKNRDGQVVGDACFSSSGFDSYGNRCGNIGICAVSSWAGHGFE